MFNLWTNDCEKRFYWDTWNKGGEICSRRRPEMIWLSQKGKEEEEILNEAKGVVQMTMIAKENARKEA